jgi:hypothetical protein
MTSYRRTQLRQLESEAVFVLREVAAQFERPFLLFSGGKDSIVLVHLARKAFAPARSPFPLLHIDTGHNFPETLEFRDRLAAEAGAELVVRCVQDSIDRGRCVDETGPQASRNALQTVTLLDAIAELRIDAAVGGGRRDEEKARAKERFFSHRDDFGQWDPKNQRPELWNLFNGRKTPASTSASSRSPTGRRWTSGMYIRASASRSLDLLRPRPARSSTATECCSPSHTLRLAPRRRAWERRAGPLPHHRRCHLHRRRPLRGPTSTR